MYNFLYFFSPKFINFDKFWRKKEKKIVHFSVKFQRRMKTKALRLMRKDTENKKQAMPARLLERVGTAFIII